MSSLRSLVPAPVISFLRKAVLGKGPEAAFTRPFFSQCGEDIVLSQMRGIFPLPQNGFFIDVGAYHPFDFSNTFMLYQTGWRGINIDPNPRCKPLFDKYRPLDTNLQMGVSKETGFMDYYMLSETSSMNSFSKEYLETIDMFDQVKKIVKIQTKPLSAIIKEYVPKNTTIDFLNVDAEGLDLEVLETIDWGYKQPTIISLELVNVFSLEDVINSDISVYLKKLGYVPVVNIMITAIVSTVFYAKKLA